MLSSKPLIESVKDYSLSLALFAFGLFLIWLSFHAVDLFVLVAAGCSILASIVSAALTRYFHL